MSNIVNRRNGLISDLMQMMTTGTSNDVKIVLEDGEIYANKDVLSARCAYFATCFSNNKIKFIEGETNSVTFNHCSTEHDQDDDVRRSSRGCPNFFG